MKKFSISDIENLSGIKAHTIRVWEIRYQLASSKRTNTNIRYYDDDDLRLFLNIATLLDNGYKISKIAKMDQAERVRIVSSLSEKHEEYAVQIPNMINATVQLNNQALNKIMKACIAELGVTNAVTRIFFPFLHKIGEMWQLGTLNPAHEHFASNLIRQKIIAATNELSDKTKSDSKRFMLFLPQDETHDVGLLLAQYLIKKQGHHTLYLGQNMPFNDLHDTAAYYKPDYAVTAVTLAHNTEGEKLVTRLLECLPHWPIIISGAAAFTANMQPHERLHAVKDFANFMEFIA